MKTNENAMDIATLAQELSTLEDLISQTPGVKYSAVSQMELGGVSSVFIDLSLDDQDSWANGIFQNSRFAQFVIHQDMKLKKIAGCGKSRKTVAKSFDSITNQLAKWASSLQ